jgi:hypothetical protein
VAYYRDKTKVVKGGEDAQFYEGRLIQRSRTKFMDQRRDVYGCMTKRCGTVVKSFRKEEK